MAKICSRTRLWVTLGTCHSRDFSSSHYEQLFFLLSESMFKNTNFPPRRKSPVVWGMSPSHTQIWTTNTRTSRGLRDAKNSRAQYIVRGSGPLNFLPLSADVTTSVLLKQILVFKADQACFLNMYFDPKTNFLFVQGKEKGEWWLVGTCQTIVHWGGSESWACCLLSLCCCCLNTT